MKKKLLLSVCVMGIFAAFMSVGHVFALGAGDLDVIEPTVDLDFVVLKENQSTTVTADLSFSGDFEVVPVTLIGTGNFSASLSRTNTTGEIVYIMLLGFGTPTFDVNIGITPVTVRTSSEISSQADWGAGLLIHGILFSAEDPPWEYSVSLTF